MIKNNLLRKQYTLNETNYQLKIPMELDACIPANDCVRLIRQFVEEMDLTTLYATYERMPSEKYASPEIMLKIMLYAYHERKDVSSRTIEKNCKRDINYIERPRIMPQSHVFVRSTLPNAPVTLWHR